MTTKKTSPNTTLTLIGFLGVIAGIAASYFLLVPQLTQANQHYQTSLAQEKALKEEIISLQGAKASLDSLKATLLAQGTDITIVDSVYPATEQMPSLYIQLENLKNKASNLQAFTYQVGVPAAAKAGDSGTVIPVSLTVSGSYADLKNVLNDWETNIRPVSFSSVSFTTSDKGGYTLVATGFTRVAGLSSAFASTTPN